MYFKDLEPAKYDANTFCVGWLDSSHPYPTGGVSLEFLSRLFLFCGRRLVQSKGLHACEFCSPTVWGVYETWGQRKKLLGSAEVRVFGKDNKAYAAPDLIFHYVNKHHYLPPREFVEAVLFCPLPKSEEYEQWVKENDWDWWDDGRWEHDDE